MNYKKGDLCSFLLQYSVKKGSDFTHTSIIKPTGSFYIPYEKIEHFYNLYKMGNSYNDDMYVTEKHREIAPILIDLDFRFSKNDKLERIYTDQDINDIINLYTKYIKEYLVIDDSFDVYVMEKPSPVIDKNLIKDGLHIVIPSIITKPAIQYIIRNHVLQDCKNIFDRLQAINRHEDIVDEAVIEKNNWQMYGSKKPNCEKYKVTKIIRVNSDNSLDNLPLLDNDSEYIELLSIRNKFDLTPIKIEKENIINQFIQEAKKHKPKMDTNIFQTIQNCKKNTYDNLEYVQKITDILSVSRADNYNDWIRTGWCLRNIDYRLLNTWITFSAKSNKFVEGECEKYWNFMKDDGLGIGTLCMWAKKDNPELFKEINSRDLSNLIYKTRGSGTQHDVANVIFNMYKHDYVCASIKNNIWYEFKNHRWTLSDSGISLRAKTSTEVYKEYMNQVSYWSQRAAAENDDENQKRFNEDVKKLNGIAIKLKQTAFKDSLMKECKELFYLEKFEEKLDSRCSLIGFNNGVYDLDNYEFREGRPEDYISFSTNINYIEYDEDSIVIKQIHEFLSKIWTQSHIKEYILLQLSSFLNGAIREERFNIWTGTGSNGKSVTVSLFEQAFGDYCCKLPIALLTQKRAASNAATSELARTKGKRFAVLQEPGEDEKLNIGLLKELSGGDRIQARQIYKEPIEFKPQFKMILCCNTLPTVPGGGDGGVWRRIRLLEFKSKFVENPTKENEFEMDKDLDNKFIVWKEYFMSILIEYYKKYKTIGLVEPEEVLECTKDYQKTNDTFLEFIEQELEKDDSEYISYSNMWSAYKIWCKNNNVQVVNMKKSIFIETISKNIGKPINVNKVEMWKGLKFKTENRIIDDLDC